MTDALAAVAAGWGVLMALPIGRSLTDVSVKDAQDAREADSTEADEREGDRAAREEAEDGEQDAENYQGSGGEIDIHHVTPLTIGWDTSIGGEPTAGIERMDAVLSSRARTSHVAGADGQDCPP